jgi:hypothetical protein
MGIRLSPIDSDCLNADVVPACCSLQVCRKPIASVLTVKGQEMLRRAFRSPVPNAPDQSPV